MAEAVEISGSPHRLRPVSATFHGRDLFAPVAAHLAAGASLADAGEPLDPEELRTLALPAPEVADGIVTVHAIALDRFGNVTLNLEHDGLAETGLRLGRGVVVDVGGREHEAHFVRTFADVGAGELLLYEDAYRNLALAVNRGSAAERLAVALDDELRIRSR